MTQESLSLSNITEMNITTWNAPDVNYWGIPKCGNTSIKLALLNPSDSLIAQEETKLFEGKGNTRFLKTTSKWVHYSPIASRYISDKDAIDNGKENFTVIRNPIERFKSQYVYNLKARLEPIMMIDHLIEHMRQPDKCLNIHFRTQHHFISRDGVVIPEIYRLDDLTILKSRLGTTIPHVNTANIEIALKGYQITAVESIFAQDFELYESR